jgi:hypothetical protein
VNDERNRLEPPRGPKPRQALLSLSHETIDEVLSHPAQRANVVSIERLIGLLRECEEWSDLYEFQKYLFKELHQVEERRAECSRIVKRLQRGEKLPKHSPAAPAKGDSSQAETWRVEAYVFERLARQLRTVGDAMAWMSFNYDRRVMVAMSFNASAGPMYGKEGLRHELGRVEELWKDKRFGLLHDVTNCIRIADITEFSLDGKAFFREMKKSAKIPRAQKERLQTAINAVNDGGPFSSDRPTSGFVELTEPYITNLKALDDLIQLSKKHGCRGMKLLPGRAVVASSLLRTHELWGDMPDKYKSIFDSTRQSAIRRAKIDTDKHHLRASSADTASRSVSLPPMSIYPFAAKDCAALICDLIVFEAILSAESLVDVLAEVGLRAEVVLPPKSQIMSEEEKVLEIWLGDRRLTVHAPGLNLLLYEFLDPRTWARGIHESLTRSVIPGEPALIFAHEAPTWANGR